MSYNNHSWKVRSGSIGGSWSRKSTYTPPPDPPLGSLLSTIKKKDLVAGSEEHISSSRITDCEYVASFNWRNSRTPSLFVPGRTFPELSFSRFIFRKSGNHYSGEHLPANAPVVQGNLHGGRQ